MKIYVPSPEEQKKIADFLSEMNETITSESAKLDALKEHKRGLMQQLFPQPNK
jgi:type I restriction enzyme S subunit